MDIESPSSHLAFKRLPKPPFVGRTTELDRLRHCFDAALRGERQLVFLSGEPGIGKTALIDAFLASIGQQGTEPGERGKIRARDLRLEISSSVPPVPTLKSQTPGLWISRGQCIEHYGAGEAYLPLLEALGSLGRQGGQEVVTLLAHHAPTWLAQLPALASSTERDALQRTLAGATRERMLREIAEALEALSVRRLLVLVLEDLHWSDPSTVELLAYVGRRRGPARLLILGAYRPTEVLANEHPLYDVVRELQGRAYGTELRLELLPEAPIETYLAMRFVGVKDNPEALREVAQALYLRTEGNPLFLATAVEQLVREEQIIQTTEGWRIGEEATAMVAGTPSGVRMLIEKQIDTLEADSQQLLEIASVVGAEFGVATVATVLGQAVEEVDAQCERLAARGQFLQATGIEEWPDGAISGRYRFLHSLYHEVLYDRIAEARRVQQHRRIAARKEAAYGARAGEIAAELAMHFAKGLDLQRAVQYLELAGGNALRRHAHHEASEYLTKALALFAQQAPATERSPQELRLLTSLGQALIAAKGYAAPEVEQAYARAWKLCQLIDDAPQFFPVLVGFWRFCAVGAKHELARDLGEQFLARAQSSQDPIFLQEAHRALGASLFWLGETPSARTHMEHSLAFHFPHAESTPSDSSHGLSHEQDSWLACLAFAAMTLWSLGYPDQALQRITEALNLARTLAHPFRLAFALHHFTIVHQLLRLEEIVHERAEELQTLSDEQGFPLWRATGGFQRGWALTEKGQVEEGILQLQQGLAAYQETGAELGRPYQLALLAEAQGKSGRVEAGLSLLNEAIAALNNSGERCWEGEIYRLKGELTLGAGGWRLETSPPFQAPSPKPLISSEAEAEECFLKAISIAQKQQAKSWELRAAMSLARLWRSQGKQDKAHNLLEEIYDWFTEGFATKDLQDAAALLRALGASVEKAARNRPQTGDREGKASNEERLKGENNQTTQATVPDAQPTPALQSLFPTVPRSALNTQDLHPSLSAPQSSSSETRNSALRTRDSAVFRHDETFWTAAFEGEVVRLENTLGMHYLAELLRRPQQDIHVRELTGAPQANDAATQTEKAKTLSAAARQRLQDLREELAEAEAFHDEGRRERLQAELQALSETLLRATPKRKNPAPSTERARLNVTRAIKTAIKKITTVHPALGAHLTQTIATGTTCSYRPSESPPVIWEE